MNRFPAMLSMLIKNGYIIAGYEQKGNPHISKTLFSKEIASN
ncbi:MULTISPECIES: hypothetical protein [Pseudoalteromonas]|nr:MULTISPECIES: hypothetical protein [Pseudoalteromonas]